jgi:lipoprotein NlpD
MKRSEKRFTSIKIIIALCALSACSSPAYKAPVVDANPIPTHRIKTHHVAPGETLYSIALRYDLDYKKLSKINGLDSFYRISPGQILNLDTSTYVASSEVSSRPVKPARGRLAGRSASSSRVAKKQSVAKASASPVARPTSKIAWSWPVKGEVLETFQGNVGLNKGIDIRGKLGEPVLAAADGEVVYSGSGLRGYGKLVIVKHNDQFLSAYAHNRVLVVAEGDKVKAGQKIAEVGFSGTNTAKLHFEIRLDGKPVDPLGYLPSLQ